MVKVEKMIILLVLIHAILLLCVQLLYAFTPIERYMSDVYRYEGVDLRIIQRE
ncbi:MAG: DUF5359 family protein [Bacilli bacterium]